MQFLKAEYRSILYKCTILVKLVKVLGCDMAASIADVADSAGKTNTQLRVKQFRKEYSLISQKHTKHEVFW